MALQMARAAALTRTCACNATPTTITGLDYLAQYGGVPQAWVTCGVSDTHGEFSIEISAQSRRLPQRKEDSDNWAGYTSKAHFPLGSET